MPTFSTSFSPPAALTDLEVLANVELSRIELSWTATALAGDFGGYRVYRRRAGSSTYELVHLETSESAASFFDYDAALNEELEYAVTVANLDGLESVPVEASLSLSTNRWWLVVEGDPERTFELRYVVEHEEEWPLEQEVYTPLGRRRRIVSQGDLLGSEGSLTLTILSDDADRILLLRNVVDPAVTAVEFVRIKTPTGDVYRVVIGSIRRRRIPGGASKVSFPYVETD